MIVETIAIGLGLVVSLAFSEILGVAAGGLIVPGYIALHLHEPLRVLGTLLAGLVTMAIVSIIGRWVLLFGRRTLVLCALVGFLVGHLTWYVLVPQTGADPEVFRFIGYIIPGLIAYWMIRQGIVETACTMLIAAFIVRVTLIAAYGGRLIESSIG
ncbi:MAG: poly-gamma-glutamate biosynthesis protein PgsC [Candidatus Eisenbacteria sp.]|nr:poly-gamma-glutamate biosynthesis protein PgsC [Candidatus Eisenbacteria bacterium]